jgi:tyrosinase
MPDIFANMVCHIDSCKRLKDISGPDTQFAYPFNFFGDIPYKNITLDYKMDFFKLNAGSRYVKVSDVMDIKAGKLCYTFA